MSIYCVQVCLYVHLQARLRQRCAVIITAESLDMRHRRVASPYSLRAASEVTQVQLRRIDLSRRSPRSPATLRTARHGCWSAARARRQGRSNRRNIAPWSPCSGACAGKCFRIDSFTLMSSTRCTRSTSLSLLTACGSQTFVYQASPSRIGMTLLLMNETLGRIRIGMCTQMYPRSRLYRCCP